MTTKDIKMNKIMTFVVSTKNDFERMLDISAKDLEAIIGKKPVFPYSRADVEKMTREEHRAAIAKWEHETYTVWEIQAYNTFNKWNSECLLATCEDQLDHLEWLCDSIAARKVAIMDMEHCGEFQAQGIYFNKNRKLVIYNGR